MLGRFFIFILFIVSGSVISWYLAGYFLEYRAKILQERARKVRADEKSRYKQRQREIWSKK